MPPKFSEEEKEQRLKAFNELVRCQARSCPQCENDTKDYKCPNGPEYDSKGRALCPKCKQGVELGAVGTAVLYLNHMDTKICLKAQKEVKKSSTKGMKSILSFWGGPKPKANTIQAKAREPALISAQGVHSKSVTLPDHPLRAKTTPSNTTPPSRELDLDGELTAHSALDTLRYLCENLQGQVLDRPNDFLSVFDTPPEAFDDVSMGVEDVWEESLNSTLHKAFDGSGVELGEEVVSGLKIERVEGFIRVAEHFERRGLDAALFKERARRLVKGLEKWRYRPTKETNNQGNRPVGSLGHVPSSPQRRQGVEIEEVPDVDDCCNGRRISESLHEAVIEIGDGDGVNEESIPVTRTRSATARQGALCSGYHFATPPGLSPHVVYPYALHDKLSIPWDYGVENGRMVLHSRTCERVVQEPGMACRMCNGLQRNNILSGIVNRMKNGTREGTGWAYFGMGGLHEVLRLKSRQVEHYRLRHLNHARKLAQKVAALDDHKRFLNAVASKKVKRVDRIIRLGLKQGRGIKGLLRQYLKAASGLYKPKSFEEEDYLKGLVLWKLGGNRIASIAHRALGLPSITTLRNQIRIPPILLSVGKPSVTEISKNVEASFSGMGESLKLPPRARNRHAVLMFDEIATEKRLRWDPGTNMVVGMCRAHGNKVPRELETEEDMVEMFRGIDEGSVHYAGEATIGALGVLSDNNTMYAARGVMVSGDCKQETGPQHAQVIQTNIDAINSQRDLTNIRLVSVASDGESRRGSALAALTFKTKLPSDSSIRPQLEPLTFMDFHVGDDDLTADKDYKHIFKRLRNLLLREKGIVVGGTRLTYGIIKTHLQAEGVSGDHIRAILNPNDKQDVKLAYDLLKAIWSLPRKTTNSNPAFVEAREALWTFGRFLHYLVLPYIGIDLSLSSQLEHLSAASHLAMFLYRIDGQECIPTILYTDIMIMIKNVIFCVAKTKVDDPDGSFWLILLGTDRLEELFGNLRTMVGNDANLDLLQTSWRLSGTAEVANILSKYPHWDRPPRRLQLPAVTLDGTPLPATTDHLKPRHWRGDQTVSRVTIQTSWTRGRRTVEEEVPGAREEFQEAEKLAGGVGAREYSILSPNGKLLVNVTGVEQEGEEEVDEPSPSFEAPDDELAEDNTDARVEIEDTLAREDDDDPLAGASAKFDRTMVVNGKSLLKSRVLASYQKNRTFPTSTDRLKRVQHIERYTARSSAMETPETTLLDDVDRGETRTVVHDPIATILWSDDRPWLALGEVVAIRVDGKAVDEIEKSLLEEDNTQLVFQLLGLRPATSADDPLNKHDWRTCKVQERTYTIPGRLAEPINPSTACLPSVPSKPFYLLESDFLVALSASLLAKLSVSDLKLAPKLAPTPSFPYREGSGKACFLCEDERNLEGLGGANTFDCEFCEHAPSLDLGQSLRVLEHNAAHIRHDSKINSTDQLCGLCLRPSPLCQFYLKKGKGADAHLTFDKKRSTCKYAIKFYYHKAAASTASAPCTNVPIRCPRCPADAAAVWKYNMRSHFKEKHPAHAAGPAYASLWEVTKFEKHEIHRVWRARHNITVQRSKKTPDVVLIVSEAHKSNNATVHTPPEPSPANTSVNSDTGSDLDDPLSDVGDLEPDTDRFHPLETGGDEHPVSPSIDNAGNGINTSSSIGDESIHPLNGEMDAPLASSELSTRVPSGEHIPIMMQAVEVPGVRKSARSVKKRVLEDADEGEAIGNCICGKRAAIDLAENVGPMDLVKCAEPQCETVWYHVECLNLGRAPRKWTCAACAPSKVQRAAKRARK